MTPTIRIQSEPFDLKAETARLTEDSRDIGAIVTFTGLCRAEDERLAALELEHYPGMAEAELERVAALTAERFPLEGLTVIHRTGLIRPGEEIVAVIAASRHRKAAFEAADFLMDYLKTSAPFWKKEHLSNGSAGDWVAPKASDDEAAERWQETSGERPC